MIARPLQQQIRRTIRRHSLCPPGTKVLVAVSGGSDSVALAFLLLDLSRYDDFTIAGMAHLNHQLRPTADRDADFCRTLAARLSIPLALDTADVRLYAATQHLSIEDAARRLRYDFLARAAAEFGCTRIAVGHTQDDQAETFLLKLMRGAGSTGLGAIYPRKGAVIRPLLDVSRADLRRYLEDRGEAWEDDESNADLGNPRNRIRHVVLPELDIAQGGAARPAIARAASLVREDAQWLDEVSGRRYTELVSERPDGLSIDARLLRLEPQPILRRIVLSALRAVARGREVGLEHVQATCDVLHGSGGGIDVPGGRVELCPGKLVLYSRRDTPK